MRYTIEIPNKYTEEVKEMRYNELLLEQARYYFNSALALSSPLSSENQLRSAEITDRISQIQESFHT